VKRCPQCNRVESDDTLAFCRVDGSPLSLDTRVTSEELATIKLGSKPASGEMNTTILPQTITNENLTKTAAESSAGAAPLPEPVTRDPGKPKKPLALIAIGLLIIVALVSSAYVYLSNKNRTPIQSVAVMPFVNESGNADVEYLSDGMTQTLIGSLSQLPNLNVKARSSVFRYKGKATDSKTIGKELSVQAILNGRGILLRRQIES